MSPTDDIVYHEDDNLWEGATDEDGTPLEQYEFTEAVESWAVTAPTPTPTST
jgi:hypothetical protein